ncbi:MAG: YukJ family protein [Actinomycetota bacterium]|nr:YukJ family protein [Actinomycetota bacterium]
MPLDRYGVLVGTLASHQRDQPDTQGDWYHVNLRVDAPAGNYRCAVDVDSHQSATGVQWKVLKAAASSFGPVGDLSPGYHELHRSQAAGALDLIRHPALTGWRRPLLGPVWWPLQKLRALLAARAWRSGSNLEAATALESILVLQRRILVWGEPFTHSGLGMHNIHQNQGDPAGSQWWDENGIWQDGGVMLLRPDGALDVFVSKFSSQASRTDSAGHPL